MKKLLWWERAAKRRTAVEPTSEPLDSGLSADSPLYAADNQDDYFDYGAYMARPLWQKPRADMSVGLQTRISQLVGTVAGIRPDMINYRDCQNWRFGYDNDTGKYVIEYNENDARQLSDDALLGRIAHLLAWQMNPESQDIKVKLPAENIHAFGLLEGLENLRVDELLARDYAGTRFFNATLWQEADLEQTRGLERSSNGNKSQMFILSCVLLSRDEELSKHNPQPPQLKNLVNRFIKAPNLAQAWPHYLEIKKLYPEPKSEQQQNPEPKSEQQQKDIANLLQFLNSMFKTAAGESQPNETPSTRKPTQLIPKQGLLPPDKKEPMELDYNKIRQRNLARIDALTRLLRSILKQNEVARYLPRQKRGKLNTKRLTRVALDDVRLFKRKTEIGKISHNFVLSVDTSGSMLCRLGHTTDAVVIFAETMNNLGLPFAIMTFNSMTEIIKDFGSQIDRGELLTAIDAAGGTRDEKMLVELDKLMAGAPRQMNSKNNIIIITDGVGDPADQVRARADKIKQKYNAEISAIAVGDTSDEVKERLGRYLAKNYGKPNIRLVGEIDELPKTLQDLILKNFHR